MSERRGPVAALQPQNNGRATEADARFTADWGGWLGALVSWLAEGVSLWL